jgi:drug/metabolite transporter (DMT)-like permease
MISPDWLARDQRLLGYAALGAVIVGSSFANVLLKIGAKAATDPHALIFGLFAWQTIVAILCLGSCVFAYSWALRQFDLHTAQIVMSLQYVSVILLSFFLLGEQISTNEWIGIALIGAGLYVCAR